MSNQTGQSLIELLIAMVIFVLVVSAITFLILGVYLTDRAARERTKAIFLAREGMEAATSIRDNNWNNLSAGSHGLAISGNNWTFQGTEQDVSGQLREGIRKIIIENIDSDRKKITSQVTWKLTEARIQDVSLITYLTNWAQITFSESCASYCQLIGYSDGTCRKNQSSCLLNGETYETGGDEYCIGGSLEDTCCCAP